MAVFPQLRLRRLRRTDSLRALVRENHVEVGDLLYPMFVVEGEGIKQEIASMPGVFRYSPDQLPREIEEVARLRIPGVMLFGIPEYKDKVGSSAYHPDGVVQKAIQAVKESVPELLVVTDVCLCEYTNHGHCGIVVNGDVDNDQTLPLLSKMALSHVEVGADIVAPSDMMDGRVKAIREALDEKGKAYCNQIMNTAELMATLVDKMNAYIQTKEAPLKIENLEAIKGKITTLDEGNLDDDITQITKEHIESGELVLKLVNHTPLSGNIQFMVSADSTHIEETFFDTTNFNPALQITRSITFMAAPVDPVTGFVTTPNQEDLSISLNQKEMQLLSQPPYRAAFKLKLFDTNGFVALRSTDFVKVFGLARFIVKSDDD